MNNEGKKKKKQYEEIKQAREPVLDTPDFWIHTLGF